VHLVGFYCKNKGNILVAYRSYLMTELFVYLNISASSSCMW